jgi:hypothetical protein
LTSIKYNETALSSDARCIGSAADTLNDTLYWLVHDPSFALGVTGKIDMIVSYNMKSNYLTYHVVSINDGGNVNTTLNFNPLYLVTAINIVDDLFFFNDFYNDPRFINIKRGYQNPSVTYIDWDLLRESLLVIKRPPKLSPTVTPIKTVGQENFLEDRFVCFAYRWKYIDGEYSATSQFSEPAFIPNNFDFSAVSFLNEGMINYANAVVVNYNSGGPLVKGIDILFKDAGSNIIKVIEKLDKYDKVPLLSLEI